ncbi:MAG TPA: hypothetical protein VGD02_05145 [Gemmatimonadaceae bacterium]|jgi:hypothetical protein
MLTGNLAHQLVLAVTTAITFGLAPHKGACPLAKPVVVMDHATDASLVEASASLGRHGLRAAVTVNW